MIERWAAEHGATELEGPVAEEDAASLGWAAARGYEEAGRNSRMVLDLTTIEAPAVEPPAGIEIVTWAERPDLVEGLWEVAREAAPDIPGEEETDVGQLDDWLERDMRGSGDRPEAVFVAVEDGEVLGYAKLAFSEETTERAFHDLTGVKRAHRGRGIAAVLKAAQIAWAKEHGYREPPDVERGSQRPDPAPEREARLRARARRRDRAPSARFYLSIASSIARRPIDAGEMRTELGARARVGRRVGSFRQLCRRIVVAGTERLLGRFRTERRRAHVRQRDPGVVDATVVTPHERGHADGRPVLGAPRELEIRPARPGAELRHADLGQQLSCPDGRLEDALEELGCGHRPLDLPGRRW